MSRSCYASRTLAGEIRDLFGDRVVVTDVGSPDGWGVTRALQVRGGDASVAGQLVVDDPRVERVVDLGDVTLIQFRPRADDPARFEIASAHRALASMD